jgi:hypothetical protein
MRMRTKIVVGLCILVLAVLVLLAAVLVLWFLFAGPVEGWQEEPAPRPARSAA